MSEEQTKFRKYSQINDLFIDLDLSDSMVNILSDFIMWYGPIAYDKKTHTILIDKKHVIAMGDKLIHNILFHIHPND